MIGKTNNLITITLLFFTLLRPKVVMCGLHEYCDNCKTRAYNIICCYVEDQCCGIDNDNVGSYETTSQFLPTITPLINTTDSTTTGYIIRNQTSEQKETNTNEFPLTTWKIPTSNNGSSTVEDIRQTSSPIISSESMMTSNNSFTLNPNSTTSIRADVSISSTTAANLNADSGNTSPIANLTTNSVPRRTTKNVDFWPPSNNTEIPASYFTGNTSNTPFPSPLVETTSNPSTVTSTYELANVTSHVVNASTSTTKEVGGIVTPSYVLNVSTTQAKSGTSLNSLDTESINQSSTTKGYESSSVSSAETTVKIGNDSSLEVGILPWRMTTKGSSEEISTIPENNLNETISTSTKPSSEVTKLENTTTNQAQVSTNNNNTNGTPAFHSSTNPIAFSPNFENATTTPSPSNTTHQSTTTANFSSTANSTAGSPSTTAGPSNTTNPSIKTTNSSNTANSTAVNPSTTANPSNTTKIPIKTTNSSSTANSTARNPSTTASPSNTTNLPIKTTNSSINANFSRPSTTTNSSTAATPTSPSSLNTATTSVTRNTSTVSMTESVFETGTNQDGRNGTSLLPNSTTAQSTKTTQTSPLSENSSRPSPPSVSTSISPAATTTDINFLNLFSTTTRPRNKSNATGPTGAVNYTSTPKKQNGTKTKPTIPTTVTNRSSTTSTSIPAVTAGKTTQLLGRETTTLSSISNLSTQKNTLKTTPRPTQHITTKSYTQNITATPSVLTVVTQFTEKSNYTTPTSRFNSTSPKMSSNYHSSESVDESRGDDAPIDSSSRKTTRNPYTSDEYETSYEDASS